MQTCNKTNVIPMFEWILIALFCLCFWLLVSIKQAAKSTKVNRKKKEKRTALKID